LPISLTCRHEAQCLVWGVRGPFLLTTAMVRRWLCVFCCVLEQNPLFSVGFSVGTRPYWVSPESSCLEQDDSCVVLRRRRRDKREINKWETNIYPLRRNDNYLRKKGVVLMPRWCLFPNFHGTMILTLKEFSEYFWCTLYLMPYDVIASCI